MAGKPKLVIVQACQGGKLRIKSLLTCFNNSHTKQPIYISLIIKPLKT